MWNPAKPALLFLVRKRQQVCLENQQPHQFIFSLAKCGTLLSLPFFPCPQMSDTVTSKCPAGYKNISPAKKSRSLLRLIEFQKRKLIHLESQSLPLNKSIKILSKSPVTLTNYPACQVCHQTTCQYDETHIIGLLFTFAKSMNDTLDSMLENPLSACLKKPPDDA